MKIKYENIINNINFFYKIATNDDGDHDQSIYHSDEDDYRATYKYDPVRLNEYETTHSKKYYPVKSTLIIKEPQPQKQETKQVENTLSKPPKKNIRQRSLPDPPELKPHSAKVDTVNNSIFKNHLYDMVKIFENQLLNSPKENRDFFKKI